MINSFYNLFIIIHHHSDNHPDSDVADFAMENWVHPWTTFSPPSTLKSVDYSATHWRDLDAECDNQTLVHLLVGARVLLVVVVFSEPWRLASEAPDSVCDSECPAAIRWVPCLGKDPSREWRYSNNDTVGVVVSRHDRRLRASFVLLILASKAPTMCDKSGHFPKKKRLTDWERIEDTAEVLLRKERHWSVIV